MKLDFHNMDIGSFPFNFIRTLSVAGTGGAEVNECLLAAERIQDKHEESWVQEWASLAEKVSRAAEQAIQSEQTITCAGYLEHPSMQLELMPRKARTGKESTTHEYAGGYLNNQTERECLRLLHKRKRGEGIL
jgi:hypothetical protein